MSEIHKNYIAGEWVDGRRRHARHQSLQHQRRRRRICPRQRRPDRRRRSRPRRPRSPPGRARRRRSGTTSCCASRQEILARREELGRLLAREEGKTLPEAIGEVDARRADLRLLRRRDAAHSRREDAPACGPNVDIESRAKPLGVVGIIAPWNFPIAIPAWKIAPALAYGNSVVFKPADLVPGCAHALAEIIVRAGAPKGVFNLVMGRGSVVGQTHARPSQTSTRSPSPARSRPAARWPRPAPKRMRKFQLEMGGKNPLVVLDDADLKIAVECARQRRLLLHRPALHGVLAPDRHEGIYNALRRRARRADAGRSSSTTR